MDFLRLTNIIRIILLFSIAPSYGQRLSAVYSSTSLEYPSSLIAAFHDGDDSIYVFGGLGDIGFIRKIYLYNITSDTIRTIGSISASRLHAGSIQQDKDGNLLYFGWHPHPYDCAMYIGCQANGDMLLLRCPEPLLFDPGAITCRPPQQVNCATTCVGKPNGVHPHPQDCSLFITCVNEELAVSGCQIPLLFDPALLQCNLPESVTC
ncbi:uncharacterized protein LOC110856009 isoform X2 [Folsomia candida]|uniref:uncharacterized protein LOC110856009 isoform X2 n=1 Tax=Folsomia candida TaxID=158441 RepID=UPI000B8EFD7D|nr:uncharacterized protein LOC110856009 isoform X2 [Folsomia candida]